MIQNIIIKPRLMGAVGTLLLLVVIKTANANLIINGDFESGNTGFSSDYVFSGSSGSGAGGAPGAGEYTMTTNPGNDFPTVSVIQSYGDHTTGSGLMMMVNGALVPDLVVWSQTVTVQQNKLYNFSAWASNWATGHNGTLDFIINGTSIGTFNSYPQAAWGRFSSQISSGSSTSFNIEIIDLNLESAGNDFSLDDISLTIVPIPAAAWLFGSGLIGLIGIARRKKT